MALGGGWKNENVKTAVSVFLIIGVVLGLFFGLEFGLHTSSPALTVISPSMYIANGGPEYTPDNNQNYDTLNDFWISLTHPFSRTLNVGDIIIIEGVNPKDLKTDYPNSDIIVYHDPQDPSMLIVHRIVSEQTINGTMYFQTKGDGNPPEPWPNPVPASAVDPWGPIPQNDIVGKVVMRIPWFGWVTIFVKDNSWGMPVIIALIIILAVLAFIVPSTRKGNGENSPADEKN